MDYLPTTYFLLSFSAMKTFFSFRNFFLLLFVSPNVIISDNPFYEDQLENYYQLDLPGVLGPESIAFDCNGKGPYAGVSDGRVLKWQGAHIVWVEFAITSPNRNRKVCDGSTDTKMEPECGRPLGLKFNPATCDLYIADAYFGLLMVGPNGGVAKQLVVSAEGIPFRLTNALDVDTKTGVVYFTDSSMLFQRREHILAIICGDRTGRLMKYDPHSKKVTVMFRGLAFPNGVALSKDNSFLLVAETSTLKILKFSLLGFGILTPQLFAQLGRTPDNIKRNDNGEFWVALNSARGQIGKSAYTDSGNEVVIPWFTEDPVAVKFDEEGKAIKVLDGDGGKALESISEVEEHDGIFYIGSVVKPYVGVFKV